MNKVVWNKCFSLLSVLVFVLGVVGTVNAEIKKNDSEAVASAVMERVNINTADAEVLAAGLHRVGPKIADAIVSWRDSNGNFSTKEQLLEVKGVGEATLRDNSDRIVL